ncbi:yif1a, partial [Symbiodinium natans]
MQGQPMQGQPMQGQPMQGQPMQGQPMQGQPMPSQPMQGQMGMATNSSAFPGTAGAMPGSGGNPNSFVGAGAAAMGSMGINEALADAAMKEAMARMHSSGAMRWFPFLFLSLQQLFNVGHSYVLRKLVVLMCPFLKMQQAQHTPMWEDHSPGDLSTPQRGVGADGLKVDVDQPDLYIPVMSYVTYVLIFGLRGELPCVVPGCMALRVPAESKIKGWATLRVFLVPAGSDFHGVEVIDTPGRGKGLATTKAVPAGGEILAEAPLFVKPQGWSTRRLAIQLQNISEECRARLLELSQSPKTGFADEDQGDGADGALLRVVRANGVQAIDGSTSVCRIVSRANHACQPNATLCPETGGAIRLVALCDLAPGEEILVSYLSGEDLLRPTWARRRELERGPWGFRCECERCRGKDLTRGMQCLSCGDGSYYPTEGGSWSCCEACGDQPPSQEAVSEAESFWQSALQQLDTAGEAQYRELAVQLHRQFQGRRGLWPRAQQHWVAAWAARAAAIAHQETKSFASAMAAAKQLQAYVRYVRGQRLVALHAEALAFRARGARGLAERGNQRAGCVAKIHAEKGLEEAESILGARHPLVRSLEQLLGGLGEAVDLEPSLDTLG